ncbi:MAG TPA: double-CXXCG motif protein, partial [Pyrinomonadaceae bacterium]
FGHSVGRAAGQLSGFVWRAWWTISLESNALQKLVNAPLNLPVAVKAELKFKKDVQEVFEFDLPLKGELINGVYDGIQIKYCYACGRDSASKPEEILINRLSIPDDTDIFRVANFTTIILATERFVETVTNLNIKGAVFEEVKIV